jgi:hypothetical protein
LEAITGREAVMSYTFARIDDDILEAVAGGSMQIHWSDEGEPSILFYTEEDDATYQEPLRKVLWDELGDYVTRGQDPMTFTPAVEEAPRVALMRALIRAYDEWATSRPEGADSRQVG